MWAEWLFNLQINIDFLSEIFFNSLLRNPILKPLFRYWHISLQYWWGSRACHCCYCIWKSLKYFSLNCCVEYENSGKYFSTLTNVFTIIWNSCVLRSADRSNHGNVISESVSDKICHWIMDWKILLSKLRTSFNRFRLIWKKIGFKINW